MNLATVERRLLEVPIGLIDEPELASRASMSEEKMDELTASIRHLGLIQPLVLACKGERFEVVAGHRRRIASARAGLVVVPAIVYPSKDIALEAIKYAENRHREDLNPAEEAVWFAELLERDCGGDTDVLAGRLGEKRAYVEARICLLTGDHEVFRALERGAIGVGVAQQLNRCTEPMHRRMLLDSAVRNGATVATVSGWIEEWKAIHAPATQNVSLPVAGSGPTPILSNDYFVCRLCSGRHNPANMRPIQMHDYCDEATLKPALEMWNRRTDYLRVPRTHSEAAELINELADRFPQLLDTDPRRI